MLIFFPHSFPLTELDLEDHQRQAGSRLVGLELGWKQMKKPENQPVNGLLIFFEQVMVGKTGFEPATPTSRT